MPSIARLGCLLIAGALLAAPLLGPAFAGRDAPVYESYKGQRKFARERARKVRRQELGYREIERRRLARSAKRARRHEGPWGPVGYPPELF